MTQGKTINSSKIALNKLVQQGSLNTIEYYDCFFVELFFKAPFKDEQWDIIENRFQFVALKSACRIGRGIKNSWKGLIMALLSLTYSKYGNETVKQFLQAQAKSQIGRKMALHFYYEQLLDDKTQSLIEAEVIRLSGALDLTKMSGDEFLKIIKQPKEERIAEQHKSTQEARTRVIASLPPDGRIEEIAGPKDWCSLYVRARYEAKDIQEYLILLSQMLDLDMKKSYVETAYSKNLPHTYEVKAAKPKYCGWYG